ncbi:fetuin-B-like isoform X2 [Sorex fumeus]|uniref:fetuin-B-like isoform X2 n=1 Tax=Sorex fumeus TaxID=62283 RepID=UPI0024AD84ED|nr:fetuin-B-like isoform X2 [Sorex fumeus]
MGLLLPLALCALATSYSAAFPAQQTTKNLFPFLSRGCNDSDVLSFAGFALEDINKDRKDGYILSLNRVSDVREQRQDDEPGGSLFYLTLDVLETRSHVLSRKSWRDCKSRHLHETVYGQCKALFYINKPRRVLYTVAYNCTLRPVSRRSIHRMCPDCPSPSSLDGSDPKVLEAVTETLAKYNRQHTSKQYSLVEVTRASSQWVNGPSNFVEYLIKEIPQPCTKSMDSTCALQSPDPVPVGLCEGSLTEIKADKIVVVNCDFFEPQDAAAEGEKAAKLPKVQDPGNKEAEAKKGPKGTVQKLPDLDDERPEQSQDPSPVEEFPVHLDLTTDPEGQALDVSFLFIGPLEEKLLVLPFPSKEQRSAECPGPARDANHLVLPP